MTDGTIRSNSELCGMCRPRASQEGNHLKCTKPLFWEIFLLCTKLNLFLQILLTDLSIERTELYTFALFTGKAVAFLSYFWAQRSCSRSVCYYLLGLFAVYNHCTLPCTDIVRLWKPLKIQNICILLLNLILDFVVLSDIVVFLCC